MCVLTNHPEGSVKFSLMLKSSTAAIRHTYFVCLSVLVCEYLSEWESVCDQVSFTVFEVFHGQKCSLGLGPLHTFERLL